MIPGAPRSSPPVRTRTRVGARDFLALPPQRYALGPAVYARVEAAAAQGLPRPSALALSPLHIEQHELLPLVRGGADVRRFIAAVAGQEQIEVVGVVGGVFARSRDHAPRPTLVTFLEWPDGYWWMAARPMDQRRLDPARPAEIRHAGERWPRPGGLGGWWSLTRVEGLVLRRTVDGADGPEG